MDFFSISIKLDSSNILTPLGMGKGLQKSEWTKSQSPSVALLNYVKDFFPQQVC